MKPRDVKGAGHDVRVPEFRCSKCNEPLDAATAVGNMAQQPENGDISVCWYCGNIGAFEDGRIRELTDAEYNDIKDNPHLLEILQNIKCQKH